MPSLMAVHWVGQKFSPIFHRLWTKVYRIKFACAGVSVVCNAVFRLTMSCCVPETFAIKSRSCAKSRRNFDVFGPPNFGGKGPPKFLTNFIARDSIYAKRAYAIAIPSVCPSVRLSVRHTGGSVKNG